MKNYKIIKIIYAKDMNDALKRESKAEVVDVELNEDVVEGDNNKIGF